MRPTLALIPLVLPMVLISACQQHNGGGEKDATARKDGASANEFTAITPQETLRFSGTEPFWGGTVTGTKLTWTTPEDPEGQTLQVQRFTGNNGLAYSGQLGPAMFDMAVTKSPCSDGMSDRKYPFTVTVTISEQVRHGCGWTEKTPFEGPKAP